MKKEELIDYVEDQRSLGVIPYHTYSTLIDGIDELEQEPCDDAISRQAVLDGIEELKKSPWATDKRGNGFEYLITEALDVVADLCVEQELSVTPQPKTGHWKDAGMFKHECSECGEPAFGTHRFDEILTNYCPNCGAKMESEDWVNFADDLIPVMDEIESEE